VGCEVWIVLRSLFIASSDRFQSLLGAASAEGPEAVQGVSHYVELVKRKSVMGVGGGIL